MASLSLDFVSKTTSSAHPSEATHLLKSDPEDAAVQAHLQAPILVVLLFSTTCAVTSPTELLNLSKSSMRVEVNLFQTGEWGNRHARSLGRKFCRGLYMLKCTCPLTSSFRFPKFPQLYFQRCTNGVLYTPTASSGKTVTIKSPPIGVKYVL